MFEGFRIILALKKLTSDAAHIPSSLVTETEYMVKKRFNTVEETAVTILRISLDNKYITRDTLSPRAVELIAELEEYDEGN
jgi:hypothetical protein